MLLFAGVKPEPGARKWAFTSDFVSALEKTKNNLLLTVFQLDQKDEMEYMS